MNYYSPRTSLRDVLLIFRHLNAAENGALTEEEFFGVYDAVSLKWQLKDPPDPWFSAAWPPLRTLCRTARRLVTWKHFEHIVYVCIVANGMAMLLRVLQSADSLEERARHFSSSWDTYLFLGVFLLEALLKVIGLGWAQYVSSGWNLFDLGVTLAALMGALLLLAKSAFTAVVILRPLRLLRLFKLKKRYRDIFGTLVLLSPLMWSTAVVMMVMYYFFAIVGMELFSKYDLRNCCVNTTVEDFFRYDNRLVLSGINTFTLIQFTIGHWFYKKAIGTKLN